MAVITWSNREATQGPSALVPPAHLLWAASPTNIVESQGSVRGGNDLQTTGSNDRQEIQEAERSLDPLHTASSTRRSRSLRATKSANAAPVRQKNGLDASAGYGWDGSEVSAPTATVQAAMVQHTTWSAFH